MDPGGEAKANVEELVLERLSASGLSGRPEELVVAALIGGDQVSAALSADGESKSRPEPGIPSGTAPPASVYLRSIIVEGFRGIGPQAALRLQPGPGLTLIAGRNGSGKSSFAEAAELVLTGENKRWSGRGPVWKAGWRNLHSPGPSRICVELAVDGQPGLTKVTREWPAGSGLDGTTAVAQAHGAPQQPLSQLGWSRALELYRPFLSYSELGALVGGRPSEMHDALLAILGLDLLIDAEHRLTDARKAADARSSQAKQALPDLLRLLGEHSDERARQAEAAVTRVPPDLQEIDTLAVGAAAGDDEVAARLRLLTAIALPRKDDADQAIANLAGATDKVAGLAGTAAADARRLTGMLSSALDHQLAHPGELCPVCRGRALDDAWATATRTEIGRLSQAAEAADVAHAELDKATRAVRNLAGAMPRILDEGLDLGGDVDSGPARQAWQDWAELAADRGVAQLLGEAATRFAALDDALGAVQADAADVLKQRDQAWRLAAAALASWADLARTSQRAAAALKDVRTAIAWLRLVGNEIRNARLAPFASKSAMVWELLRQESNVELGPIRLEGTSTQRRVALDVTVDGIPGAALSVMSQGELHALALALFLPRATAQDSPFRFVMIDDPVQSMDPAKVDGLARLLAQVASDRQVVVFTHDDRLPEAIRRLGLPATIWEVTRREHSVVELIKNDDPVEAYLDDARALALTNELSKDARAVVVAGYCRSALEAACHEAVRARRIRAGARHADVERDLEQAQKLYEIAALALFDDPRKGSQVLAKLRQLRGQAAVDAFVAINSGTHDAYKGDLKSLIKETARIAEALRR